MPIIDRTTPSTGATRFLFACGGLLVASGLLHVGVMCVLGGSWEGHVSWRKPILFGLSAGATLCSLAWVAAQLPRRRRDVWMLPLLGVVMVWEVGLITGQQWRGVPSHFLADTPLDRVLLQVIEALILVACVVVTDLTYRCLQPFAQPPDQLVAIRAGMCLLWLGCLLGIGIAVWGHWQWSQGRPPGQVGPAGVAKFPHGMPLHAIQIFPLLVGCWRALGCELTARLQAVRASVLVMGLLTLYSLVQTIGGRGRWDWTWASLCLLGLAALLSWIPLSVTARALARRLRQLGNPNVFLRGTSS